MPLALLINFPLDDGTHALVATDNSGHILSLIDFDTKRDSERVGDFVNTLLVKLGLIPHPKDMPVKDMRTFDDLMQDLGIGFCEFEYSEYPIEPCTRNDNAFNGLDLNTFRRKYFRLQNK